MKPFSSALFKQCSKSSLYSLPVSCWTRTNYEYVTVNEISRIGKQNHPFFAVVPAFTDSQGCPRCNFDRNEVCAIEQNNNGPNKTYINDCFRKTDNCDSGKNMTENYLKLDYPVTFNRLLVNTIIKDFKDQNNRR